MRRNPAIFSIQGRNQNDTWGKKKSAVEDFESIIKSAYFEYQRAKVFLRTNSNFRDIQRRQKQGVQYASEEYMEMLRNHEMIPSISRPGRPQDNARCESFLKTLNREEIYANDYRDLAHLSERIEEFIERYYNRCRLHSALGYRSPDEFENQWEPQEGDPASKAATITG